MKRTTNCAGLDVHQATTVAAVRTGTGQVIMLSVLPTDEPVILEWIRGMRGGVHVVLGDGTQARWLHDLLAPIGGSGCGHVTRTGCAFSKFWH